MVIILEYKFSIEVVKKFQWEKITTKWYFVTKIVLTYCEKKKLLRICKNFEINKTAWFLVWYRKLIGKEIHVSVKIQKQGKPCLKKSRLEKKMFLGPLRIGVKKIDRQLAKTHTMGCCGCRIFNSISPKLRTLIKHLKALNALKCI